MTHDPKYPSIALAADVVLICPQGILLIKRKNDPYKGKWALPGGFVGENEWTMGAARRELLEETGVEVDDMLMRRVGVYDAPDRDPRGRTVSIAYLIDLPYVPPAKGMDDAVVASFFDLENLPPLAFDHVNIIADAGGVWLRQNRLRQNPR